MGACCRNWPNKWHCPIHPIKGNEPVYVGTPCKRCIIFSIDQQIQTQRRMIFGFSSGWVTKMLQQATKNEQRIVIDRCLVATIVFDKSKKNLLNVKQKYLVYSKQIIPMTESTKILMKIHCNQLRKCVLYETWTSAAATADKWIRVYMCMHLLGLHHDHPPLNALNGLN